MSTERSSADRTAVPRSSALFDRLGHIVFAYRDALVPAALVAVLALTRPQAPLGSERLNAALDLLGVLVALSGQALRITVIGFAYVQRGGAQRRLSAPKLVCEGIYAHCRNPMYVGDVLFFLGLCLIYNSTLAYAVVLPVAMVALLAMVGAEERFLAERFGARYAAYRRDVNRFMPRLHGLRATMSSLRFDWRRVLRKEYGTTFAWVSAAVFLLAWERIVRRGWGEAEPALRVLLCVYAPVPIAYAVVRWMKKTSRLRSPD